MGPRFFKANPGPKFKARRSQGQGRDQKWDEKNFKASPGPKVGPKFFKASPGPKVGPKIFKATQEPKVGPIFKARGPKARAGTKSGTKIL